MGTKKDRAGYFFRQAGPQRSRRVGFDNLGSLWDSIGGFGHLVTLEGGLDSFNYLRNHISSFHDDEVFLSRVKDQEAAVLEPILQIKMDIFPI